MRTQSSDTSPEIERFQIAGLRAFAPAKKFASVRSISASMLFSALQTGPDAQSDYERALQFVRYTHPASLVAAFQVAAPPSPAWMLQPFDLREFLSRVHAALNYAVIPYALMGATARGIYGFPGGVNALDLLVDVHEEQVPALIKRLRRRHMVVERKWRQTLQRECLLHLISPSNLVPITFILPGERPDDSAVLLRSRPLTLDEQMPKIPVVACEDCLLQGLKQYQIEGEHDDALYNELLGIVKIQQPVLDYPFLQTQAYALGLTDVFGHLLDDAGIQGAADVLTVQFS